LYVIIRVRRNCRDFSYSGIRAGTGGILVSRSTCGVGSCKLSLVRYSQIELCSVIYRLIDSVSKIISHNYCIKYTFNTYY